MAGAGGGPSRRSHTKSRKGCKTCKKRHIRCDEGFPQCNNCTKHQVRCDYLDQPSPVEGSSGSGSADLLWTMELETIVQHWQTTNIFPFPSLQITPQPQWTIMSMEDLRLIYHIASISNALHNGQVSRLTIWSDLVPKAIALASTSQTLLSALLAFSANHLAWISQNRETKALAVRHSNDALKCLHQSIAQFSQANADETLASTLLLSWISTDCRSWLSLTESMTAIIHNMQAWRDQSLFHEFLTGQGHCMIQHPVTGSVASISVEARTEHMANFQNVQEALDALFPYLPCHEQEQKWIEQLRGYLHRLISSNTPHKADDQFTQLYALRKWLLWVPVSLLTAKQGEVWTYVVLAYFYAVALHLETAFPIISSHFIAYEAVKPLEHVVSILDNVLHAQPSHTARAAVTLIAFARTAASNHRSRTSLGSSPNAYAANFDPASRGLTGSPFEKGRSANDGRYIYSLSPSYTPVSLAPSPIAQSPLMMDLQPHSLTSGQFTTESSPSNTFLGSSLSLNGANFNFGPVLPSPEGNPALIDLPTFQLMGEPLHYDFGGYQQADGPSAFFGNYDNASSTGFVNSPIQLPTTIWT